MACKKCGHVALSTNLDDQGYCLECSYEQAIFERDELRRVLDQMLTAWGTGELACDVINGRWWGAVEDAKRLTGSDK